MTNLAERRSERWAAASLLCPKQMSHGPCAGVSAQGSCEVPEFGECTFVSVPPGDWPYLGEFGSTTGIPDGPTSPSSTAAAFLATAARRPVVVTDLPAAPLSAAALLGTAAQLTGASDALLLGDHGGARVQFPPSYRAKLLVDAGFPVWAGINCRDRNRVAIEGEIAACLEAGAIGVHCVTGDHTRLGHRPDAHAVFDLDCIDVVGLARRWGVFASVAHAPSAPPVEQRLPRLLAKVVAGAQAVFVDHCGGPDEVAVAVNALRSSGYNGLIFACVPVVTSVDTAAVVESFAGDRLPRGYVAAILAAADPGEAGVAAAVELSRTLLEIAGVDGVNLSGGAGPGQELVAARHLADIGRQLIDSTGSAPELKEAAR